MNDSRDFDVIVIGAGPGGTAAANTAAVFGKRVAIVEKNLAVGGAAVNTGTLPSKTMRETALALSGVRARGLYGVDLSLRRSATIDDLLGHERAVRTAQADQMRDMFGRYGVTLIHGAARFFDAHTVEVADPVDPGKTAKVHSETIVVAIGSAPVRPPEFPFGNNRVHDSDELTDIHEIPKSMAVIGSGVIGSEYACTFAALGVKVHLIDGRDALLPFLDPDITAALKSAMVAAGIEFHWSERVTSCDAPEAGDIRLTLSSGKELAVDHVLVCAGRASGVAALNPAAAGLAVTGKGRLAVNEQFQTGVPHIYAVGDVIGFPALASTSFDQGRVAACHACGSDLKLALGSVLPSGIYTIPEAAAAGLTEPQARAQGIDIVIGRADYARSPRGKIIGEKLGFLKLIFRRDDLKLLGVHVIGEQATELVHIGLLALTAEAGAQIFIDTCFNYPTLGELYKVATHEAIIQRRKQMG